MIMIIFMNMTKKSLLKNNFLIYIFSLLLLLWLGLSLLRTLNNLSKIATEERFWIKLSSEQKHKKLFGDIYTFIDFVDKNTRSKSKILFISYDGKPYYYGRYLLFPKILIYESNINNISKQKEINIYDYLAFYNLSQNDVKKIFSSNNLYQKNMMKYGNNSFLIKIK